MTFPSPEPPDRMPKARALSHLPSPFPSVNAAGRGITHESHAAEIVHSTARTSMDRRERAAGPACSSSTETDPSEPAAVSGTMKRQEAVSGSHPLEPSASAGSSGRSPRAASPDTTAPGGSFITDDGTACEEYEVPLIDADEDEVEVGYYLWVWLVPALFVLAAVLTLAQKCGWIR